MWWETSLLTPFPFPSSRPFLTASGEIAFIVHTENATPRKINETCSQEYGMMENDLLSGSARINLLIG